MDKQGFYTPDQQLTAKLAGNTDWKNHPLGNPENWPLSLRYTLNTLFNTRQAVCIFWGEQSYYFYNDAYIPILGENKHPWAMGKPGKEVWGEIWEFLIPQIQQVMTTGQASWNEDQFLPIIRAGLPQEAWFTYSYSPVIDEHGKIQGTLVICIETTSRVRSEQRLGLVTSAIPQLVWTARADGYCDFLSQQWADYTGTPSEQQLGYEWLSKVIHPDDQKRTAKIWEGATKDQNAYDLEYRVRRFDGVYRWFKVRGTPLRDNDGKITYWVGTCTDIEDAIQAKIEYEKNVDLSPAILWITDKTGSCTYLSKQWYEVTGQKVEEGLGFGWLEATHPDDKEKAGKAFVHANENQTFFRVEYRLKDKHGNYRWAIDAGNPRFDSEGNFLGIAGTVFDVHEQKMAEQAARESREDMYRILMQAPAAVAFLKSPELIFTIANDRYRELIGKGDSIMNKAFRKALPELEEETHRIFEAVFSEGKPYVASDFKATLERNGILEEAYFNFVAERILDVNGKPEGIIVVALEVTEQVKARQALNRAIHARDEFMSVASHELKTPLTSLKLQTQSAKRRLSLENHLKMDNEKLEKVLTQNESQINRLVRLVDDMLDLTRVQSGKLQYNFTESNLCEIVTDVCGRLKEQFEHANIDLDVSCGKEVHLKLDRERIEQVIINLLTNALKYGKRKPVTVSLEANQDFAHILVKDEGMGIKPENQEIIFDRFQRLISPNEISGLGIGLYISKEIVEAHAGKIWVDSDINQGSTFHVELPIHAP